MTDCWTSAAWRGEAWRGVAWRSLTLTFRRTLCRGRLSCSLHLQRLQPLQFVATCVAIRPPYALAPLKSSSYSPRRWRLLLVISLFFLFALREPDRVATPRCKQSEAEHPGPLSAYSLFIPDASWRLPPPPPSQPLPSRLASAALRGATASSPSGPARCSDNNNVPAFEEFFFLS